MSQFPDVMADLHTMEDVFLNLLVNARHAMEQAGRITIKGVVERGTAFHVSFPDTTWVARN